MVADWTKCVRDALVGSEDSALNSCPSTLRPRSPETFPLFVP